MKLKIVLVLSALILLIFENQVLSQNWPKIYGENLQAYGKEIIESYDFGYFIGGSILHQDATHFKYIWIIKTDINGNTAWDRKFGDASYENYFSDFDETRDNGLIISGSTAQQDIEQDPLFVKVNSCGEIQWCKIFKAEGFNTASGIVSLPNGGYIGMIQYYGGQRQPARISLVKMDSSGDPLWIIHFGIEDSTLANEEGSFLNLTPENNYLISGHCFSPNLKPFFIKTDTLGKDLWDIKWPLGTGGFAGQSVFATNNVIYNGSHLKFTGHPKVPYLLKFNTNGDILDQYPLMGDTIDSGGAISLLMYNDSILFTGTTWMYDNSSWEGFCDILKIDTLGNLISLRRLINDSNPPTSIIKSFDNKILAIGTFQIDGNWDIYLWKMNSDLEDDTLYTQPLTYDSLCPYPILSDTVDLDCSLFVKIDEIPTKEEYESTIKISPNPSRDWIALSLPDNLTPGGIELAIYNAFGQEIMKIRVIPEMRTVSLNISNLSQGFYLAVCKDSRSKVFKGKFIVGR